jgi:site-specific recombinase XerD
MKLVVIYQPAACPYRLLDDVGYEVAWANDFLDAQHLRQLSPRSLRAYAYDLLHFTRWFQSRSQSLSEITESTLLDYVRYQLSQQPQPTPQTVNHRLTVIRCLYRFHYGLEIPARHAHFQLRSYLHWERPLTNSPHLFVSLKGRRRGQPMTPAGLRSLFRHHRSSSEVRTANPHRFRHTFGADMVRAGISLPALQHLMGHSQIQTTLLYVQLAPSDIWREYARAVANRSRLSSPPKI